MHIRQNHHDYVKITIHFCNRAHLAILMLYIPPPFFSSSSSLLPFSRTIGKESLQMESQMSGLIWSHRFVKWAETAPSAPQLQGQQRARAHPAHPGPPRPAGRYSPGSRSLVPGPRSRAAGPDPCPRAAPHVRTLSLLPRSSAGSEAPGRRLIRSRHPRSPGRRSRRARLALFGAPGRRLGGGRPAGGAGRAPSRPHVPPGPHSHSVGN